MAFNHLPAGVHDALAPLSVTPVTHSVPMANNLRSDPSSPETASRLSPGAVLDRLAPGPSRASRITHTEHLPPRAGRHAVWPDRIRSEVVAAVQACGIEHPWAHQARAAEHALDGDCVVGDGSNPISLVSIRYHRVIRKLPLIAEITFASSTLGFAGTPIETTVHSNVGGAGRPLRCQKRPTSIAVAFSLPQRQPLPRASSVFSAFPGGFKL